jgi:hypothetical protein
MTQQLTNQELLRELEKRLPNFNGDELFILGKIMIVLNPYKEEISKFLKEKHPETHGLMQKTTQEIEKREKGNSIKFKVSRCQVQ